MSDRPKSPDDCPDDRSAGEASIILVSGAPGVWKTTLARQQRKDSVFAPVTRYTWVTTRLHSQRSTDWQTRSGRAEPTPQQRLGVRSYAPILAYAILRKTGLINALGKREEFFERRSRRPSLMPEST